MDAVKIVLKNVTILLELNTSLPYNGSTTNI